MEHATGAGVDGERPTDEEILDLLAAADREAHLRAALRKYGRHLHGCSSAPMYPKCTCGFYAALRGGEG